MSRRGNKVKKRAVFIGIVFLLIAAVLFSVSKIAIKDFKEFFGVEIGKKDSIIERSEVEGNREISFSLPADSPLARGEHPRIFFTADKLPKIRGKILVNYKSEFQNFINELDANFQKEANITNFNTRRQYSSWGALNYAFLGILDVDAIKQLEPTLTFQHTSQEYCAKALEHARAGFFQIAAGGPLDTWIYTTGNGVGSQYINIYSVYDWCYSYLNESERLEFVQTAIDYSDISQKNEIANAKRNPLNSRVANIHALLPVISFYGDAFQGAYQQKVAPYESMSYSEWGNKLYNKFEKVALHELIEGMNIIYSDGGGWSEGPSYMFVFNDILFFTGAFQSALGKEYLETLSFFQKQPIFRVANTKPALINGARYYIPWTTVGGGLSPADSEKSCRNQWTITSITNKHNPDLASLMKWDTLKCPVNETQTGGLWNSAVLYLFLYGTKDITAKTPSQLISEGKLNLTNKLGLREYIMRTGYESPSDSLIQFWAQEYAMSPGGHYDALYGHFGIEKFGNLITKGGNSKSAWDALTTSFHGDNHHNNVIGLNSTLKVRNTVVYDETGNYTRKGYSLYDFGRNYAGTTLNTILQSNYNGDVYEDINSGKYDYIFYNSTAFKSTSVPLWQREFVYLRGEKDKEFVVVFDRMNVTDKYNKKFWHAWVPSKPELNGNVVNPRIGKFESDGDLITITNNYNVSITDIYGRKYQYLDNHGRLFIKKIYPENSQINVIGGDWCSDGKKRDYVIDKDNPECDGHQHEFEDANGTIIPGGTGSNFSILYPGKYHMTDFEHDYMGWGRVEIMPVENNNYDIFLNVMQFGDSRTLNSMSETTKLESEDGKMVGSHIRDSSNQWVVLFANNSEDVFNIGGVNYTLTGAGEINHLIVNLKRNYNYDIYDKGTKILTKATNNAGVIYFTSSLGSTHGFEIKEVSEILDTQAPTITITSPYENDVVSDSVSIIASGEDDRGIAKVEFSVDGKNIGNSSYPFAILWDSNKIANGEYVLTATAYDEAGSFASSSVQFSVANGPVISNVKIIPTTSNAVISWITSRESSSKIEHGNTASYGSSVVNASLGTSSSLLIEALSAMSSYYYKITATDAEGNVRTYTRSFKTTTLSCSADITQNCCGDRVINKTYEGCDDGNSAGGDGCSASCSIESGWGCSGEPSVCNTLQTCSLTKAYWSRSEVFEDKMVSLIVEGNGCSNLLINFEVESEEFSIDAQPASVAFSGNKATASWNTEFKCFSGITGDECSEGNPQYFFSATLSSDATKSIDSQRFLTVLPSGDSLCSTKNLLSDSSLRTYLTFDENHTSENITKDYTTNNNDGKVSRANIGVIWNETGGIFGGAYKFINMDDTATQNNFIALPNNLMGANINFTIMAWVKRDTFGAGDGIFTAESSSNYILTSYIDGSNRLLIYLRNSTPNSFSVVVDDYKINTLNIWYNIVFVREGAAARAYINGEKSSKSNEDLIKGNLLASAKNVRIGRASSNGGEMNGSIDEFAFFDRVLSDTEIDALYRTRLMECNGVSTGSAPLAPSNLIASLIEGRVHLSWNDNSNDEDEFIIERSADGVNWVEAGRVSSGVGNWEE